MLPRIDDIIICLTFEALEWCVSDTHCCYFARHILGMPQYATSAVFLTLMKGGGGKHIV